MKKIYFAHDQQESPSMRKAFLEMAGYSVTLFKSSGELLAAIETGLPDLVLLDALVEGQNGFAVCRELRKRFPKEKLPVIMGSHIYRTRIYRDEALAAGAQRYLLHPVSLEELAQCVVELLGVATTAARV